jgi:acyl carrier protein
MTRIKTFVLEELGPRHGVREISEDESLVERGLVDSLGVFQLIAFLEEEFGVTVADDDVTPENFRSVSTIERFVLAKRGGAA